MNNQLNIAAGIVISGTLWLYLSTNVSAQLQFSIYPEVNQSSELQPLFFGLMVSFGGTFKSSGVIPGVQMALDLVNDKKRINVLGNHTLHYVLYDSQCNRTDALNGLFNLVLNSSFIIPYDIIAILGSGCSTATIPTAEVSHYYNIPQISCVSSANELSDRVRFKGYYQLLPSDIEIAPAFHSIIREYNWTRVAFITQNEPEYVATTNRLMELLAASEKFGLSPVEISERKYETDDIRLSNPQIEENPFDENSRIFMLAMSSKQARQVICKAHNLSMWYPKYLFLTYGSYESNWWVPPADEDVHHQYTPAQRTKVLHRSLAATHIQFVNHSNNQDLGRRTDTFMTKSEFLREYGSRLHSAPFYFSNDEFSQFCFDATWALIKAINSIIDELGDSIMDSFDFETSQLIENLGSTGFNGITGPVEFDPNGIRVLPSLEIIQYREAGAITIAHVNCSDANKDNCFFQYTNGEDNTTVWTAGVPYDGVPRNCIVTVHWAISAIFVSLSTLGVIFTISCIIFNFVYRDRKIIRLTSPNLNYLIGIGAVLVYIACAVLFVQPTKNPSIAAVFCIIEIVTLPMGFTIAFAAILAKIGRIYIIFRMTTKKVAIKDWYLVAFVLLSNCVNGLILLVYVIYEGVVNGYGVTEETNTERPTRIDDDPRERLFDMFFYGCSSDKTARIIVLALVFGYLLALMVVALWFAFQVRKVKVTGLNDSKATAAIVYLCSIMTAICVAIQFGIRQYINVFPVVYGSSLLIGISALVGLVFVPKMLSLYRDPSGEGIFTETSAAMTTFASLMNINEVVEMEALKQKIKDLEDIIKKGNLGVPEDNTTK